MQASKILHMLNQDIFLRCQYTNAMHAGMRMKAGDEIVSSLQNDVISIKAIEAIEINQEEVKTIIMSGKKYNEIISHDIADTGLFKRI